MRPASVGAPVRGIEEIPEPVPELWVAATDHRCRWTECGRDVRVRFRDLLLDAPAAAVGRCSSHEHAHLWTHGGRAGRRFARRTHRRSCRHARGPRVARDRRRRPAGQGHDAASREVLAELTGDDLVGPLGLTRVSGFGGSDQAPAARSSCHARRRHRSAPHVVHHLGSGRRDGGEGGVHRVYGLPGFP
jgi:hypothetical protein